MKKRTSENHHLKLFAVCVAVGLLAGFTSSASAQDLLAHWTLDLPQGTTFPDSSTNNCNLYQDPNTTDAILEPGIAGYSAYLNWSPTPGTSTRLYSTNSALQTDSFGFSFWIQPIYLNDFDNFIIKESGYNNTVPGYARFAWQVHMLGNSGNGTAQIEFIVRGQNGGFVGVVTSATNLSLYTGYTNWVHVAGGYDSVTGDLSLFVNGLEADASGGTGAYNSDGSPFDIGTAANGSDYVAFAAGTYIDDVQLYDSPLSSTNVDFLMANPGYALGAVVPNPPIVISPFSYDAASGDMTVVFNSINTTNYAIQASTDLVNWTTVTNVTAPASSTTAIVSQSQIDSALGLAPRTHLFIRIQN